MEENYNDMEASLRSSNDEALPEVSEDNCSPRAKASLEDEDMLPEYAEGNQVDVEGSIREDDCDGSESQQWEDNYGSSHYKSEDEEYPAPKDFKRTYASYGMSSIGKEHLEHGDQVIMPASTLESLLDAYVEYPMLFEICNEAQGCVSHCGVSEFTAEEGLVHLPNWMMDNLQLQEGNYVTLKYSRLEKGTYIKLQPLSKDFFRLSNPKAALEETLSANFFCLTTGDTIKINRNNKDFYINVLETKPSDGICIIDTDCEVEFAAPLDYVEPARPAEPEAATSNTVENFVPFTGRAQRLDGKPSAEMGKMQP